MSEVENTSKRESEHHLFGALVEGKEGYITGMEAEGQHQLVNSEKFPTDREDGIEEFGFTFSEPDLGDPLFCDATLPKGWKRESGDHSMWSYIVDERGIRRVSIFYKAAFYDRDAHAHLCNPGAQMANSFLYGDDIPKFDLLNDYERAEFVKRLNHMEEQIERYPDIYNEGQAERLVEARRLVAET